MKNLLTISLIATTMFFMSCGNDDSDDGGGGINITNFTSAILDDFGANGNGSFDVDITLLSDFTVSANGISDLTSVYLDLNTSIEGELEAGTYTFGAERDVFIMVDAEVTLDAAIDSDGNLSAGQEFTITDGTVEVSVSGSTYTITFNLTASTGETITGSYTGELTQ